MPRPIMPAPITATVFTSAMRLAFLQGFQNQHIVGIGLAHVITQAFFLFHTHGGNASLYASKGGSYVIHKVHHANQFTSNDHAISCSLYESFILSFPSGLVKPLSQCVFLIAR